MIKIVHVIILNLLIKYNALLYGLADSFPTFLF